MSELIQIASQPSMVQTPSPGATPPAYLYVNRKGVPVRHHSYSGGDTLSFCKQRYNLERVEGYLTRSNAASKRFGIAIESAIQRFYERGCVAFTGINAFEALWEQEKDSTLNFTAKESNWQSMMRMGSEMMALFEIRAKELPIAPAPKFQLKYTKEVFPGSHLAGIDFVAYVDMYASDTKTGKPRIIDIKTSTLPLPEQDNLLMLDPQLRKYSWVTGVPDVAFLWFVKAKIAPYKRGDKVTVIGRHSNLGLQGFPPGSAAIVFASKNGDAKILSPSDWSKYEAARKGKRGKEAKLVDEVFGATTAAIATCEITRQRVQFVTAHIDEANQREAGEAVGLEIAEIVNADRTARWPKEPGIRFPNNKCGFCPMRGNCTNNAELRDRLVYRADEDWLDQLEQQYEEAA